MKKTFIVASASYSEGVERWVDSVDKNRGEAQPLIVMYQKYFDVPNHFLLYKQEEEWCGVVRRLFPLEKIVEELGEEHWYVWTDCCDVVLQTQLPDLDQFDADVLVCSEQLDHKDAEFWSFINHSEYFKSILPLTVYNVGCFAAKGRFFKEFIFGLRQLCEVSKVYDGCLDQLFFNKWLRAQKFKSIDKLFICLYSTYTEGHRFWTNERMKLAKFEKSQFSLNSVPYSIVHGNGYTKDLLNSIQY